MPITYLEAIREAQAKVLAENENVYIYGQDVAAFGGAFKATKHLAERFPGRVLDAPISEDAMIGSAIGAAIEGMRPIVEMQFADFSSVAFNQIVNQAATHFYRTGVPCPLVVRLPSGGTEGSGPFHSQCLESIYAHYPGVVVMTPATVEDAYWMFLEAVGRANVLKPGRHATVVTHSAMVHESLKAAHELATEGWDIEVVDLRTVKPIDTDTVLGSVARTGRLLCVGEGFPWGGVTAEVVARVVQDGFHLLDAPPQRLNCRDTPIPYHPNLWKAHRPTSHSIAESLRHLLHL
jgi:pyruvate dehydrogenase E1 component beta subunit/2-oxoisovalerate dehydrogenase E1 component beta subunit